MNSTQTGTLEVPLKRERQIPIRAVFIRHGQSTANIGIPCRDIALVKLTDLGWNQAKELVANWTERPDRIVVSPYLRTQQTAEPTIRRFPDVPVETWPIQEFCYLQPHRWTNLSDEELRPHVDRYWTECNPEFCDGEGAESFSTLLARAQTALDGLAALPDDELVFVFTHGHFILALWGLLTETHPDERSRMRSFWQEGDPRVVGNTDQIWVERTGGDWQITAHLPGEASVVQT